jgi:hypothetical protein
MKHTFFIMLALILTSFTSAASNYNEANWYLSVDIEQVRNTIIPLMPNKSQEKSNFSFENNMPKELTKLTLYGHSEQEDDLSVMAFGDFRDFSLNDYIIDTMYQISGNSPISLQQSNNYQGTLINHFVIDEEKVGHKGKHNAEFFSAKLSDNHIIISLQQDEVKNWIDQKYNINDLQQSDLVSLLINIKSAIAHMGTDLSKNSQPFNSAVFQKINQFSASMYEAVTAEELAIEAALTTADEATAKQLEQVVNGLIAMNALSNIDENKPAMAALMSSLNISQHGKELLITTSLPLALISQIDID